MKPGPELGRLLEAIREGLAAGEVSTRKGALGLAAQIQENRSTDVPQLRGIETSRASAEELAGGEKGVPALRQGQTRAAPPKSCPVPSNLAE